MPTHGGAGAGVVSVAGGDDGEAGEEHGPVGPQSFLKVQLWNVKYVFK
jgi:hypothetical protein